MRVELRKETVVTTVNTLVMSDLTEKEKQILYQVGNWHFQLAHDLKKHLFEENGRAQTKIDFTEDEISDTLRKIYEALAPKGDI